LSCRGEQKVKPKTRALFAQGSPVLAVTIALSGISLILWLDGYFMQHAGMTGLAGYESRLMGAGRRFDCLSRGKLEVFEVVGLLDE
jgi:hypothetical protein